ncbi:MAG: outer membrane beta-barrel protein [Legionellales bacterium]|jgi:opacity protein-like surface antigen
MKGFHQHLILTTCLAAVCTTVLANDFEPYSEFILMGGITTIDAEDTDLVVTASETDKLVQTNGNDWDTWTGQIGFGYVFSFVEDFSTGDVAWFPIINPQINLYVIGDSDITGDVWRFESPAYNQADYTMGFRSTRVMFDLGVTIAAIDRFSIYALGGLGAAWNSTSFNAQGKDGLDCPIDNVNLNEEDSSGFAYEFGGGLTFAATDRVAISLEYLYTGFDDVDLGGDPALDIDGSNLYINAQSVLLGLRFAI